MKFRGSLTLEEITLQESTIPQLASRERSIKERLGPRRAPKLDMEGKDSRSARAVYGLAKFSLSPDLAPPPRPPAAGL